MNLMFLITFTLTLMATSLPVSAQTESTSFKNSGPILVSPIKVKSAVPASPTSDAPAKSNKAKKEIAIPATASGTLPTVKEPNPSSEIKDVDSTLDVGEVILRVDDGNKAVKKVRERDDRCETCELAKQYSTGTESRGEEIARKFKAKEANQEGQLVEPSKDENTTIGVRSAMCGSRDGGYDVCISSGDVVPSSFKFVSPAAGRQREWQFSFENNARQDLGFSISDVPADGSVSRTQETYMMVFPRKYVPSIRIAAGKQIVTLANGEMVSYDLTTKKILGGVLSEDKTYSGNGVVVRADRSGDDPRFGKGADAMATISKQGKTCKVPKKSLWPDQSKSSALHFKFATDVDFDAFLKQKCGFGL